MHQNEVLMNEIAMYQQRKDRNRRGCSNRIIGIILFLAVIICITSVIITDDGNLTDCQVGCIMIGVK